MLRRTTRRAPAAALVCIGALALAACGSSSSSNAANSSSGSDPIQFTRAGGVMKGPEGQPATPIDQIKLSPAELATLRTGHYSAAIVWHENNTAFTYAETAGMEQRFRQLGIKVVAVTDAQFNPAKQRNDIESVLALKPSVILSIPVSATLDASAYREAVSRGTKLVFLGDPPVGFKYGRDFIGTLSDDEILQGNNDAYIVGKALHGKGKVGMVYYAANFFVTNERDAAFRASLKKNFPGIQIVAQSGFQDPANTQAVAAAMITQHPDLNAIYSSWAQPGEGVLAALRAAGRKDIKLVSIDLSDVLAVDMARCGNTIGESENRIFDFGVAAANVAALGMLGKPGPQYAITTSIPVTRSNLLQSWKMAFGVPAPATVQQAMKQGCSG